MNSKNPMHVNIQSILGVFCFINIATKLPKNLLHMNPKWDTGRTGRNCGENKKTYQDFRNGTYLRLSAVVVKSVSSLFSALSALHSFRLWQSDLLRYKYDNENVSRLSPYKMTPKTALQECSRVTGYLRGYVIIKIPRAFLVNKPIIMGIFMRY